MSTLITTTRHLYSGICVCGHPAQHHHGNMIFKIEVVKAMESGTWYAECEHYGCNESWEPCPDCPVGFVDRDDPLRWEKMAEYRSDL